MACHLVQLLGSYLELSIQPIRSDDAFFEEHLICGRDGNGTGNVL